MADVVVHQPLRLKMPMRLERSGQKTEVVRIRVTARQRDPRLLGFADGVVLEPNGPASRRLAGALSSRRQLVPGEWLYVGRRFRIIHDDETPSDGSMQRLGMRSGVLR